uniref:Uncharacterized protein n=1 Tax=Entomoneis paludosa TaxID=265537 RepID=A0A7S2V6U8_9STRA|mmetsp:Transcript_10058/g.20784  ORF Transcript_10058/g.20784 Transcript_10058/m.20784 type:complete len:323 (+) Transcript_10058:131-1099(+)|eukprot:CAMPEP_0172439264 /NCGR_PEP_ID=MMETSP1065-20121228/309_1 /TAXON_ID=265537 /ORGANISM="Amphiprora paludosa, Strain CCMP125" /LENGTH=322 /DNA_ID=CAMNT_0013187917 /DNA_START=75 /DNA_END=1043 /DNA_ORIENTATION=-
MAKSTAKNSSNTPRKTKASGAETTVTLADPPATTVSPGSASRSKHVRAETQEEKGKIMHATQLMPEESSTGKSKKRDAQDEPSIVTPPPSKRRRTNVTIQRSGASSVESIPAPPSDAPPAPTKYLKVLLLGPEGAGKQEWLNGLNTQQPETATGEEAKPPTVPFALNYQSKDYSFESSAAVHETVRLHMYNVDCSTNDEPPASWKHSLVPSMQHVVLVLDLFQQQEDGSADKTLRTWKTWLERNLTKNSDKIPISLLLVNNNTAAAANGDDKKTWFRLGASVEKLCRYWHINKWYMMENDKTSSDTVLQTLIERTWTAMDKK